MIKNPAKNRILKAFFIEIKGKTWFLLNIFFTVMYLLWRVFFTIPFEYGVISIITGVFLLIVELLGMVEAFIHYLNMSAAEYYPLPTVPSERYPHVDIFVPSYSEGRDILYKTLNACRYLKYPDKSKVHIYLCDDNRRPEMRALAAEMGVGYFDRPDNMGAKAGNLNNAMAHTSSPYVVTIDADMILKSDFLMKTIPYFIDSEIKNEGRKETDMIKLGFVQTPQSFYNPDLFQFNLFSEGRIPDEQDYFYKDIQIARTRTNSVIYGGSNTVLSREALNAAGGFYTGAITEDFATGILIEKNGYVSLGLSETLASGLSPNDLPGLIQQRIRWARGVISTGRKMHIFRSRDLSFAQKMNYWASIWYWYAPFKRLIYIMAPLMYAVFGFMVFKCTLFEVLLFWLPMYVTSNISLKRLSHNIRSTKWTGIYETAVFPFLLVPVLLESFGITLRKFHVTNKGEQAPANKRQLLYMVPFMLLIMISVLGIINCIRIIFDSGSFDPIVVLFWITSNIFMLIMAMFFVSGRDRYRKYERSLVQLPCEIMTSPAGEKLIINGVTENISETGLAVRLDKPYYIKEDEEVTITVKTEDYRSEFSAKIVYVSRIRGNMTKKDAWRYAMLISDFKDGYDDWLGILYDRVPTLPTVIQDDSGSFEDLKLNSVKRVVPPFYQKRKLPRIEKYYELDSSSFPGGKIEMHDFNYNYLILLTTEHLEKVELSIPDTDIEFLCEYAHELNEKLAKPNEQLYRVTNTDALWADSAKRKALLDYLCSHGEDNAPPAIEANIKDETGFDEIRLVE